MSREMMLRDNDFKRNYDTNFDTDVVSDFYIPALASSTEYKRMTGFFSSSSLAVAAEGIAEFIRNNGKMKMIASPILDKDDIRMLETMGGEYHIDSIVTERLLDELTADKIREDHIEAFAWMLANDMLEVRIVLVMDDGGTPMHAEQIVRSGIFHNKVGILSDGANTVAFTGSINETYAGWKNNIESFMVFWDWEDLSGYIKPLERQFDEYWELGRKKRGMTVELPEAVKNRWVSAAPSRKEDLKVFRDGTSSHIRLRDYQIEAIDRWFDNEKRGFFNMATATGKTVTAIYALKKHLMDNPRSFTVIAVPFQHLMQDPWLNTIERELKPSLGKINIIQAFGGNRYWRTEMGEMIEELNLGVSDNLIVITTYDTLSSKDFIENVRCVWGTKTLIADEVHNAGAKTYRNGLLEEYDYRLGLSATPSRYFDEEGSEYLANYFNKEVFTFSLQDAINTINPSTGETFLTPYIYHPVFVTLTADELESYDELTKKIARYSGDEKKLTPREIETRDFLRMKRARILKNAENKLESLDKLFLGMKKRGELRHCLVYCSDGKDPDGERRVLSSVIEKLNRLKISNRRFAAEENPTERKAILDSFESGETEVLVAIKCLDEGVDVPATKNAVIMASTGNPREYIQRRGRVLRRFPGKKFATIYDFMIIPGEDNLNPVAEKQIFASEYARFKEFSDNSLNAEDNNIIIAEIMEKHDITLEEIE